MSLTVVCLRHFQWRLILGIGLFGCSIQSYVEYAIASIKVEVNKDKLSSSYLRVLSGIKNRIS